MCGGGAEGPKQSPEEKALGELSIERWNDYQSRFRPVEDQFIKDVQITDSDYSQARGQASTAVQQSFDNAEKGLTTNLMMKGHDPSSNSFVDAVDDISLDRGLSMGAALNETNNAVDEKHVKGLQTVVAMGQGQATDSMKGLSDIAYDATRDSLNRAQTSFDQQSAGRQLVGQAMGLGTSAYLNSKD